MLLKAGRDEASGMRPKKKVILKDPSVPAWSTLKLWWFIGRMFPREGATLQVLQCMFNRLLSDESSD